MSEAKYYKSVKTGVIAELVGKNEHGVILLLDNGEERVLAASTLKRWWTELNKAPQLEMLAEEQAATVAPQEDGSTKFTGLHKQFMTAINKFLETSGSELFFRETMGTYNLRSNGTIYLWFKLTRKGVNVFAKSKAVGTDYTYTPLNHNFDMKIVFNEWDSKAYHTLRKLHDLSLRYQANKKKK